VPSGLIERLALSKRSPQGNQEPSLKLRSGQPDAAPVSQSLSKVRPTETKNQVCHREASVTAKPGYESKSGHRDRQKRHEAARLTDRPRATYAVDMRILITGSRDWECRPLPRAIIGRLTLELPEAINAAMIAMVKSVGGGGSE
jgi:hypothetical protein